MTVKAWQRAHNRPADMPKSGVRTSESSQWRLRMSRYLLSLAVETGFGPDVYIHAHFRSHKARTYILQGGSDSGMRESIEGIENLSTQATPNSTIESPAIY